MKPFSLYLQLSLTICVFVIGVGVGYYFTPEYTRMNDEYRTMNLGVADNYVDLRYINAMIAHHRGAILLAEEIESKTSKSELKNLAKEIKSNEPKLIAELYDWKRDWYSDKRAVRDPKKINLGSADEKVDLRFLNALIAHHEAGIVMTQEIRTKSSRAEILSNADAVENFLKTTLVELKNKRNLWYGI